MIKKEIGVELQTRLRKNSNLLNEYPDGTIIGYRLDISPFNDDIFVEGHIECTKGNGKFDVYHKIFGSLLNVNGPDKPYCLKEYENGEEARNSIIREATDELYEMYNKMKFGNITYDKLLKPYKKLFIGENKLDKMFHLFQVRQLLEDEKYQEADKCIWKYCVFNKNNI